MKNNRNYYRNDSYRRDPRTADYYEYRAADRSRVAYKRQDHEVLRYAYYQIPLMIMGTFVSGALLIMGAMA